MKQIARVLLIGLALGCGAAAAPSPAAATVLPPGFEDVVYAEGFSSPTGFAWAPDGRVFVAEKFGRVRVVLPGGEVVHRPLLDLSDQVAGYGDRGLLGIAADTDFAANGWLYLLYSTPRDPTDHQSWANARLTRITVRPDNTLENPDSPETVILGSVQGDCTPGSDCFDTRALWHTIGTVRSAPDGTLYVGNGDGADFMSDSGRSRETLNIHSYQGKILRVDRQGRGVPDHPFCPQETDLTQACTKVYARGLRNPFRFELNDTGLTVGDVGHVGQEEINLTQPGRNYGWPCREGAEGRFPIGHFPECELTENQDFTAPDYQYPHGGGASVVGGPQYRGDSFPASYRNRIFFGDYRHRIIRYLEPTAAGYEAREFASEMDGVIVDFQQAPNGSLAYLDIGYYTDNPSALRLINYSPDNLTPVARLETSARYGPLPLKVRYDASASSDPENKPLSYAWDLDGDGQDDAQGPVVERVYNQAGAFTARLTVTDQGGRSAYRRVLIVPGDTPPRLRLIAPSPDSTYVGGRRLRLEAEAHDEQDGPLSGHLIAWRFNMRHNDHFHGESESYGRLTGFVPDANHGLDQVSYRITAIATDSSGLSDSQTVDVSPRAVQLLLRSSPANLTLSFDGEPLPTPARLAVAAGSVHQLSAPAQWTQSLPLQALEFSAWSHGGEREQQLVVPDADSEIEARYQLAAQQPQPVEPNPPRIYPPDGTPPNLRVISRRLYLRQGRVRLRLGCYVNRCHARVRLGLPRRLGQPKPRGRRPLWMASRRGSWRRGSHSISLRLNRAALRKLKRIRTAHAWVVVQLEPRDGQTKRLRVRLSLR